MLEQNLKSTRHVLFSSMSIMRLNWAQNFSYFTVLQNIFHLSFPWSNFSMIQVLIIHSMLHILGNESYVKYTTQCFSWSNCLPLLLSCPHVKSMFRHQRDNFLFLYFGHALNFCFCLTFVNFFYPSRIGACSSSCGQV